MKKWSRTPPLLFALLLSGALLLGLPARPAHAWPGELYLAWSITDVGQNIEAIAWADYDGDGTRDMLAVGIFSEPVRVYRNDNGMLNLAWTAPDSHTAYTIAVAWGDWNNDGCPDLAVGNSGQSNRVYQTLCGIGQPGDELLNLVWTSAESERTFALDWGDWDGDGDLDLAVGNMDWQINRIYRNTGGALESAWISPAAERTVSIAWGDWDGDGDLDLAEGNNNRPNRIYRNTGGVMELAWSAPYTESTTSIAWADMDGDGDLDLAVGNSSTFNRVYRNTGGAMELAWTSTESAATRDIAWGDYDGDGDLDLAVGNFYGPNRVYANTGDDLRLGWTSPEIDATTTVVWGDVDGDGGLDLAIGGVGFIRLYRNTVSNLESAWTSNEVEFTDAIAWGDWDNDGDLDLAVGNYGAPVMVYRNTGGNMILAWASPMDPAVDGTNALAWGDYDGDGDLDLALGNDGPNQVYRNTGGDFELAWTSIENESSSGIAWGDWDNDGKLDLAVSNFSSNSRIYRNTGNDMVSVWETAGPDSSSDMAVAWGDWDGDGRLDLAFAYGDASVANPARVYTNTGSGMALAWSAPTLPGRTASCLAWGDWDGDGDLDLALGSGSTVDPIRVYRNTGAGMEDAWVAPIAPAAAVPATTALDWGDWDGDGDLDLAVGNRGAPNQVYRNDGGDLYLAWVSADSDATWALDWGDWDGDGDLDLVAGNLMQPTRIYRNTSSSLALRASLPGADATQALAWGDWDGDGDLDLAVGNAGRPNLVYAATGAGLTPLWTAPLTDSTQTLAWGDWDGDGDLDLAVGNAGQPSRVYANTGSGLTLAWSAPLTETTCALAWGDWDGDGALDLAVGNDGQPLRLYHNTGGDLELFWSASITDATRALAWGDWDGDSDLDLAVGNTNQPNRIYRNHDGQLVLAWSSTASDPTTSLAWSDSDNDGRLDLAVGNANKPNRLYRNTASDMALVWSSSEWDNTTSLAWGDWDGDGDFDLAVGNDGRPNRLYTNNDGTLTLHWSSAEKDATRALAWGDWDNDGDLDLAVGNYNNNNRLYINHASDRLAAVDAEPTVQIAYPGPAAADFFAAGSVFEGPTLPITYTLFDPEGHPAQRVEGYYSLDGGGTWQPAVAIGTVPTSTGAAHVYTWDLLSSGILGLSQDTRFRLDVYQGLAGVGPFQYPFQRAHTLPFRVRGNQVRVLSGTLPVENALVYRLPAEQTGDYTAYQESLDTPWRTNAAGYLRGQGEIGIGDRLIALAPITTTETYILYYTNAPVSTVGLLGQLVEHFGIQNLVVSAAHPLILFNLDVSLEWDARQDMLYLDQLAYDLQRTSEFLYDWSNGQIALGQVHVYHERGHWNTADVRIYASNRLRPSAIQGGVTRTRLEDPDVPDLFYEPGIARMGVTWSRYGESGSHAEDWPRALAHELGHYLLYLDDNYLGFDAAGQLIPIDTCPGAMSDPYRGDWPYDEFHALADWLSNCEATLSHQRTGRADWTTVQAFYPQLHLTNNTGPSILPLAVTQVQWQAPLTPPTALADPTFYLMTGGTRVQPSSRARAFLFQDDWLTDLGAPRLDRVNARGARVGDRLCLLEADAYRFGCETIGATDRQLELLTDPVWQPDIIITPVSSRTLTVQVGNLAPDLTLHARLYAASGETTPPQPLALTGDAYQAIFTTTAPAIAGYLHVWDAAGRDAITDYALGGNPAPGSGAWSGAPGSGAWSGTPTLSSDGQVSLYSREIVFPEGEFYALQATTVLPAPPAWATVVGQAYRLLASSGAPPLTDASLSFQYLGSEVPAGEEPWLAIYYWDGSAWQKLPTVLDLDYNLAAAPAQGPGLYVLMASLEIPLPAAGWNLFSYPVNATRPVTEALLSITDSYTTVYGYESPDPLQPWRIYDKLLPPMLNTLTHLHFGRGYWISVTEAITLNLRGAGTQALNLLQTPPLPPATYYGLVQAGPGFTPVADMPVTAWVGSRLCGQTTTQELNGELVYLIHVEASCDIPDTPIRFRVEAQPMSPLTYWDNTQVHHLPLAPNQSPVAEAGVTQSVTTLAAVTLDGSPSYDPDGHYPLTYGWTQSGGPAVAFTPNVSVTIFSAPTDPAVLTFTLTVTDSLGVPAVPDTIVIVVENPPTYYVCLPLVQKQYLTQRYQVARVPSRVGQRSR